MFGWVALGISLATIGAGVVIWIRGYLNTRVSLEQSTATLHATEERLVAEERAAAAEREARDREFDAEKSAVTDAAGAAELLRRQLPGSR